MINALIIDDEPMAIKGLELELSNFPGEIQVVRSFSSAAAAVEFLGSNEIDVVFLDMEMPDMTGLDFLAQFASRRFQVVFTTAHNEYALNAIREDAVYYLLKPVDFDELTICIQRITRAQQKDNFSSKLDEALERFNDTVSSPKKIRLAYDGQISFFSPEELLYLEAHGNYTQVHFTDGSKILLTRQLKQAETELPSVMFYRIHKSYIINLAKIRSYSKQEGMIVLENNISLPVSIQKRNEILDRI